MIRILAVTGALSIAGFAAGAYIVYDLNKALRGILG